MQSSPVDHPPAVALPELPAELREALIELLAQALVAELLENRKGVQAQMTPGVADFMVGSPPGLNHPEGQARLQEQAGGTGTSSANGLGKEQEGGREMT